MAQQASSKNDSLDLYVPVAERIARLFEKYPNARIITSVIEHDRESGFILMQASVYRNPDDAEPAATGHAFEYKDAGYVQRTSHIEVAETSAVGRALAFLNFETKRGIASLEEVKAARAAEDRRPVPLREVPNQQAEHTRLDAEIILALTAIGKTEAELTAYAQKRFKTDSEWQGLRIEHKQAMLRFLGKKADRQAEKEGGKSWA